MFNSGSVPVVLTRIRLVDPTPGLEVVGTAVGGPDRELLTLDRAPDWPSKAFTDQHAVAGFVVAPSSLPDGERGVELLFGLRAARPGSYQARAIAVEYAVGEEEHVAYVRRGVNVCVSSEDSEPVSDCALPSGMNDPIDER